MENKNTNLNWKTAAVVGTVSVAVTVGICYYLKNRSNVKKQESLETIESVDFIDAPTDLLKEALAMKERGNSFFKGQKYENALKCYIDSLQVCPASEKFERAKLYQNKAVALENLGRLTEVLPNLNEALQLYPKYEKALNRRSKFLEVDERYQDALIDVTAAAIFDNFRTPEYLNRMESLVKRISEKEMESVESDETLTLQSDRYISIYLKSFPSDPFLSQDEYETAGDGGDDNTITTVDTLSKCVQLYRDEKFDDCFQEVRLQLSSASVTELSEECLSRMLLLRATFYTLSCREQLALTDLNATIANRHARPSVSVNALIKRAMLMTVLNDIDKVEKSFTEALQIDADCADIYYHRGSFYESCARFDDAIRDFSRALELMPDYSFAAIHKAYNDYQRNKMVGAASMDPFISIIKQFPRCVECHVIYAQVLLSEGNLAEAEKMCNKILKVQPGSGTILMTLAMVKLSQEKVSDAKRLLQDTIKLDPKYAFSYHTLATIFIKDGDLQKAIELMNQAVKYARNKQELQNFIATREGVRAQLNVSVNYNIPPSEIFAQMMRAANMSLM